MSIRMPPNPAGARNLSDWAADLYQFMLADTRIAQPTQPRPVQLSHLLGDFTRASSLGVERPLTDGMLMFDPLRQTPVVSLAKAWTPLLTAAGGGSVDGDVVFTTPTVFQGGANAQGDTSAAGVVIDNFTPALWLMDRSSGAYGYMLQANGNTFLLYQTSRDGGGGVEVLRSTPGNLAMNVNQDVNWPGIVVRSGTTNGSSFSVGPSASSAQNWTLSYRGQNNADEFWIMWENDRKLGLRPDGAVYVGDIPVSASTARSGISLFPTGGISMQREAADTNPSGARISYYWGTAYTFKMSTNGNLQNANNSYGSLSDARMKKDIADLSPQLEDLLKLRPVSYVKTDDPEQRRQAGLIAQEVQQVKPGLVEEPDPETGMLAVKYSVLVPLMLKALQELTAEVRAGEGAA